MTEAERMNLLLIDTVLIIGGVIAAIILDSANAAYPSMFIAIGFNVIIGATNTPENCDSKFRAWLFKKWR